jgi:hypothetical protein
MHHWHIWLDHLDRSAMAEHSINLGHHIQLRNTSIPSAIPSYINSIFREAIEIRSSISII